jgi:hypothetical protein
VDTIHNAALNEIDDHPSKFFERNSLVWGAFLLGVMLGFAAVYVVVAQPMFTQVGDLKRQLVSVEDGLHALLGADDQAWEAGNLLSDLNALKTQIVDARATVREIRQCRQDLLDEARHTADASAALTGLVLLQNSLLEQQELTKSAADVAQAGASLHQRIVEEASLQNQAAASIEEFEQIKGELAALRDIVLQLSQNRAELPEARQAAGELVALKDQVLAGAANADDARTQANRMLLLQEELAKHAEQSSEAFHSLDGLVAMQDRLVEQAPAIADAIQNLELISDFQGEFGAQLQTLDRMRESLMQIILMESTIGRVARVLEPLVEIANVRRLSSDELREAARAILENRATRISSRPGSSSFAADPDAFRDPFSPQEQAPLARDPRPAPVPRPEFTGSVPDPKPLPLTE